MGHSLLSVCLWAVCLLVVIQECQAGDEPACTEAKKKECSETGQTCQESNGECNCESPKQMIKGQCIVPACTEAKKEECSETGQTCQESNGECNCESPKQMIKGQCIEPACTKEKKEECSKTGQTCQEPNGECNCESPKQMIKGQCIEPACTEEKKEGCSKTGQTCQEPTGECTCESPKQIIMGRCIEPACTEEKKEGCSKTGRTCQEPTGECTCESPKQIIKGQCIEPACTDEKKEECSRTGQTCQEPTGECTCESPKQIIKGQCIEEKSPATQSTTTPSALPSNGTKDCKEKLKECENTKKTSCKLINGTATCVCPPSMKETENGDCFVAKKLTIRFTLKSRQRRSAPSSEEKCAMDRKELIQEIKLSVPSVIEDTIVCNGSDVTFDVFAENEENEKEITDRFEKCKQGCQLGAHISIEPGSAEVIQTNLCEDKAYKKLEKEMGLKCDYANKTRMVCNNETSTAIGEAILQGIPFEVCKALPCTKTTCDDDKKHCVQGSCVCKPQYKDVDGKCKSMCEVTPSVCPVGATCVLGQGDQSFYCDCPPKLTGPLCTRENKPLQTAKLNIVVVGVVLASLLLLCFVVSASIISRLRKKVQGPSFSKDCERRPQRELRGYDGPYKASDPASLHRGRDHTSL